MELGGILLRRAVAQTLVGQHVDHHRLPHVTGRLDQLGQPGQVVTVHRAEVLHAHVLEQGAGGHEPLDPILQAPGQIQQPTASGDLFQNTAVLFLHPQVFILAAQPGQVAGHAADVAVDGHLVVIEDDHHGLAADGQVVEAFVGHAAGGGAVANEGDHIIILLQQCSGPGHAQSDGNGTGGMTGNKSVRIGLMGFGEAGHSAKLTQTLKIRLASGQKLMDISLMTHIKNQTVFHRVINGLKGDGELHCSKVGSEVSAGFGDAGNKKFPDLPAEPDSLPLGKGDQVLVTVDIL